MVSELIDFYGLNIVQAYMSHIQSNAEIAVRDLLRNVAKNISEKKEGDLSYLKAKDYLDDGSEICLTVSIDSDAGNAVFDFR